MNRLVFPEMYLDTPYKFDKALLKERNKLVIVRFGRENEIKTKVVDDVRKNFTAIDWNKRIYIPKSVNIFYRY